MKCILVTLVASKFTSGIVENDPIFNRLMMFQYASQPFRDQTAENPYKLVLLDIPKGDLRFLMLRV